MARFTISPVRKLSKIGLTALLIGISSVSFAVSPYINKVYEYSPAPGQFTNLLPAYEDGDTDVNMCQKAEEAIANNQQGMISLGGWGGYVVFGFDHPVINVKDSFDLLVLGNAFYSNPENPSQGGSCEPGVIRVSYDANQNGEPDDEWYEIAGSEYGNKSTYLDYELTYFRPSDDHVAMPDKTQPFITDTTYIAWTDNKGGKGYMNKLAYHTQPYFPQWIEVDQLTFSGTRLPDNGKYDGEKKIYLQYPYQYGYADNHPNTADAAKIKLDWAVKPDGSAANLSAIHFVKVYTGVHQQYGATGETSTEISGAEDLHPDAKEPEPEPEEDIENMYGNSSHTIAHKHFHDGQIYIIRAGVKYNIQGMRIQ